MKAALLVISLLLPMSMACSFVPTTPEYAFRDFQTFETKESYIVLPPCNAGNKVVPIVNQRVREKDLDRRLYAIVFLGVYGDDASVSTLKDLVSDESETEYFRSAALESIFVLRSDDGRAISLKYVDRTDLLGRRARNLLAVEDAMTYADAYRGSVCFPTD